MNSFKTIFENSLYQADDIIIKSLTDGTKDIKFAKSVLEWFYTNIRLKRNVDSELKLVGWDKRPKTDKEIKKIVAKPEVGIEKKGDLRGVFVHKFKIKSTQHLLSYRFTKTSLELIMLGPHENYYRDLKKHIR